MIGIKPINENENENEVLKKEIDALKKKLIDTENKLMLLEKELELSKTKNKEPSNKGLNEITTLQPNLAKEREDQKHCEKCEMTNETDHNFISKALDIFKLIFTEDTEDDIKLYTTKWGHTMGLDFLSDPITCPDCDKEFETIKDLKKHMKEFEWKCFVCGECFKTNIDPSCGHIGSVFERASM